MPYILEAVLILYFIPLDTCQRKLPGKPTISIATQLVLSPYFSLALSLLRFPFFLHPQHCPQIRQGFSRGELETVHWWSFFFFFQSLFLDSAHAPPVVRRWGLLKATVSQFLSTSLKFKFSFGRLQVQALCRICARVQEQITVTVLKLLFNHGMCSCIPMVRFNVLYLSLMSHQKGTGLVQVPTWVGLYGPRSAPVLTPST